MRVGRAQGWVTLAAAIGVFAVALGGCSSSGNGVRSGTKARPLELAAGAPSRSSSPVAVTRGALSAGRYYTSEMVPTVTFTVGPGWTVYTESSGDFGLYLGSRPDAMSRDFVEVDFVSLRRGLDIGVLDPPLHGAEEESVQELAERTRPIPGDFVGYLRGLGYLDVGPPESTTMGGLSGVAFDVTVGSLADLEPCRPQPDACRFSLFTEPTRGTPYVALSGARLRIWLLAASNGPLLVNADAFDPSVLALQRPAIDTLLASVQFG